MKTARIVLAAYTVLPSVRLSIRSHTTSYINPLEPDRTNRRQSTSGNRRDLVAGSFGLAATILALGESGESICNRSYRIGGSDASERSSCSNGFRIFDRLAVDIEHHSMIPGGIIFFQEFIAGKAAHRLKSG